MNKTELKEELIKRQNQIIDELREKIQSMATMSDLSEDDTNDPEDYSHQSESTEMGYLLKQQLEKALSDLLAIKEIDFSKKEKVAPGALVSTETFNFFIGVASVPFDFQGKRIIGISTNSPIYPQISGKQKGESFAFLDSSYTVKEIF